MNGPTYTADNQDEPTQNDSRTDLSDTKPLSRRSVLKQGAVVSSGALVGGSALVGGVTASQGSLVSKVASNGHYAWFPLGPDSWGRSQNPIDKEQDVDNQDKDARWLAEPAAGGGIRCRVENLPTPFRNAGFDVHLGSLGSVKELTVESTTQQTTQDSGTGTVIGALYFDVNDNGEFFAWEDAQGNTESWVGFGGDTERGLTRPATGRFTIDDDTELPLFAKDPNNPPTLREIKAGEAIDEVDGDTNTAIYLGAPNLTGGTEDIIVESLDIERA